MSAAAETSTREAPAIAVRASRARLRVGFIVGPTGTGKTALALQVAERLGAEIVNADSRLLYRGLDIGTAKPSPAERSRVPHHLIDVCGPDAPLDVAGFREMARRAISEIAARGRPVLVVGGSGLYLKVLRGGIFTGPPASARIREELGVIAAKSGVGFLHEQLRAVDPEAAARILPNDLYRIIRALEVFRISGTPISVHQRRHGFASGEYDTLTVGLALPRESLYRAIGDRFDVMVAAGLVEEVRSLIAAGYRVDAPPLSTIGYRHIAAHLRGEISLEEAIAQAKRDTRRLAKRQLTWFRRVAEIIWVDPGCGQEQAFPLFASFFSRDPADAGG